MRQLMLKIPPSPLHLLKSIRAVINLEACGVAGAEMLFQATSNEVSVCNLDMLSSLAIHCDMSRLCGLGKVPLHILADHHIPT